MSDERMNAMAVVEMTTQGITVNKRAGSGRSLCLAAAFAGLAALPATAGTFTPPSGCTLEMTIQNRSCTVAQHYRCSADDPGDQRVTIFTRDGAAFESRIDQETRWMESTNLMSGLSDRLVDEARDHASFADLLRTGRDEFDFWTESNNGERLRHIGHDILTGEIVEIGGVPLEVTQFDLRTYSETGEQLIHRQGSQFISRTHGRFYGGVETSSDWTGATHESNDTPMRFAFPGQPGFGDTVPQYDCDLQMVKLPLHDAPLQPIRIRALQ